MYVHCTAESTCTCSWKYLCSDHSYAKYLDIYGYTIPRAIYTSVCSLRVLTHLLYMLLTYWTFAFRNQYALILRTNWPWSNVQATHSSKFECEIIDCWRCCIYTLLTSFYNRWREHVCWRIPQWDYDQRGTESRKVIMRRHTFTNEDTILIHVPESQRCPFVLPTIMYESHPARAAVYPSTQRLDNLDGLWDLEYYTQQECVSSALEHIPTPSIAQYSPYFKSELLHSAHFHLHCTCPITKWTWSYIDSGIESTSSSGLHDRTS